MGRYSDKKSTINSYSAIHSHADSIAEQIALELSLRECEVSIETDLTALTQNTTLFLAKKVGAAWPKMDKIDWAPADPDVVPTLPFMFSGDLRLIVQSQVIEGAVRSIPITYRVKETI